MVYFSHIIQLRSRLIYLIVISVSGTLVQIPGHGNIILDCGEGSWGQLTRIFGDEEDHSSGVWQVLRDLNCIFLSHVHGDHHIGLAKILAMRQQVKFNVMIYIARVTRHLTIFLLV